MLNSGLKAVETGSDSVGRRVAVPALLVGRQLLGGSWTRKGVNEERDRHLRLVVMSWLPCLKLQKDSQWKDLRNRQVLVVN